MRNYMENNDFLEIKISGTLYISTFEKILNQYYRESLNKNNIVFDLRRLEWTGFFPASLFFSWFKHLNGKKTSILLKYCCRKGLPCRPKSAKYFLAIAY